MAEAAAEDGGMLIERGELRVDRERVLRVVRDHQVPERVHPLLLFVRCAVASGAGSIRAEQAQGACALRCDGAPLPRALLELPFTGLFAEEGGAALRPLAQGLLRALRERPRRVVVESGPAGARFALELRGVEDWSEIASAEAAGTSVRVEWGERSPGLEPAEFARDCALVPGALTLNGRRLGTPFPEPAERVAFRGEARRGALRAAERRELGSPGLSLFSQGVRVGDFPWPGDLPVRARVDDGALRLDASLSGIVRDAAHARLTEELRARERELLPHAAAGMKERLLAAGELLARHPELRPLWHRRRCWSSYEPPRESFWDALRRDPWRALADGLRGTSRELRVLEAGYRALWLRKACDAYGVGREEPAEADLRALHRAPLLLNESGFPVSLAELREACASGRLLHTESLDDDGYPGREAIIWCPEPADREWLLARFPEALAREPRPG